MEVSNSKIKNFFYFLKRKLFLYFLKKVLIFSQKKCQFFGNRNLKKILMFHETELSYTSGSNFPRSKIFYTFSYKETKNFKLKCFLIIII